LPPEVLAILKIKTGDNLKFDQTPEGIVISPCSDEFAKAAKAGKQFMDKYPAALQTLAKT
jgi:bifunctional DNA-binding transcriptional regulator/antitoxin component of YhaV-PrlF toxin-antitoxin module